MARNRYCPEVWGEWAILLALTLFVLQSAKGAAPPGEVGEPALRSHLDKSSVTVGKSVRLRSTVPQATAVTLGAEEIIAYKIGTIDGGGHVSHTDPRDVPRIADDLKGVFTGLPSGIVIALGGEGAPLTHFAADRKGVEHSFTPKTPGVYTLASRWLIDGGAFVCGVPTVLTVRAAGVDDLQISVTPEVVEGDRVHLSASVADTPARLICAWHAELVVLGEFTGAGSHRPTPATELASLPEERRTDFPGLGLDPKQPFAPVELKPVAPGRAGVDVPFTPKRPGVYLLRVTWELKDGGTLTGPPVVLTVRPKPAAK